MTLLYKGVAGNPENGLRVRLGWAGLVLGGPHAVTNQDAQFLAIDCGADHRDVTMPLEGASQGSFFYLFNVTSTAKNIVIKASDGVTTRGTIAQGNNGWVICDGSSWNVL